MAGEKAWQQLHKNAASNFEQVLEATPQKAAAVRPLNPITKIIQVRRTRHAGNCWRSRDELISAALLWTPSDGRAKAGRSARTYIQQLSEDTGWSPEDLPDVMNEWEKRQERVRDIRADSMTRWWLIVTNSPFAEIYFKSLPLKFFKTDCSHWSSCNHIYI